MLHSNAKKACFFKCWICTHTLVGWGHVLDLVWVVLSDGENIGHVTYLIAYSLTRNRWRHRLIVKAVTMQIREGRGRGGKL